jgi:hypothetical protein
MSVCGVVCSACIDGELQWELDEAFSIAKAGTEYGPNKMPMLIGLYGGRYMIVFHPQ